MEKFIQKLNICISAKNSHIFDGKQNFSTNVALCIENYFFFVKRQKIQQPIFGRILLEKFGEGLLSQSRIGAWKRPLEKPGLLFVHRATV